MASDSTPLGRVFLGLYECTYLLSAIKRRRLKRSSDAARSAVLPSSICSRTQVNYSLSNLSGGLTWNYAKGYNNDTLSPSQHIASDSTIDLQLSYGETDHRPNAIFWTVLDCFDR